MTSSARRCKPLQNRYRILIEARKTAVQTPLELHQFAAAPEEESLDGADDTMED
jgi:hypothetical protein